MSNVNHPSHYHAESGIEVIDAIEAWGLGFSLGNAVKYIARAGHKNDAIEDLRKALWYVQREVNRLALQQETTHPEMLDLPGQVAEETTVVQGLCDSCKYEDKELDDYPCDDCIYAYGHANHYEAWDEPEDA